MPLPVVQAVANDNVPKTLDAFQETIDPLIAQIEKSAEDLKFAVPLSSIGGLKVAKDRFDLFVARVKFAKSGFQVNPEGFLLHGAQGTGKKMIAFAFAKDNDMQMFSISSADVLSMWPGKTEKYVVALSKVLKAKALVFFSWTKPMD